MGNEIVSFFPEQKFEEILYQYIPETLKNTVGNSYKSLPRNYRIAVVATVIATRIIYDEGLHSLEGIKVETHEIMDIVAMYLKSDDLTKILLNSVEKSDLLDKSLVKEILGNVARKEFTKQSYLSSISEFHKDKYQDFVNSIFL